MKLFILDSNKKTLQSAVDYFKAMESFETVDFADNGVDGLNAIIETKPDFIVMDLILSGIDGFGVLKKIDLSSCKVVVTTAMCSDEIVARAFAAGVSYVMIKPYSLEQLSDCINALSVPIESYETAYSASPALAISEVPDYKKRIIKLLHDIGITPNLKGFRYLRSAISLVVEDEAVIEAVTKIIYPEIAREYKTTPVRAERAIRHAIETSWDKDGGETMKRVFNLPGTTKRPTNSEFIGLASEYIKK